MSRDLYGLLADVHGAREVEHKYGSARNVAAYQVAYDALESTLSTATNDLDTVLEDELDEAELQHPRLTALARHLLTDLESDG